MGAPLRVAHGPDAAVGVFGCLLGEGDALGKLVGVVVVVVGGKAFGDEFFVEECSIDPDVGEEALVSIALGGEELDWCVAVLVALAILVFAEAGFCEGAGFWSAAFDWFGWVDGFGCVYVEETHGFDLAVLEADVDGVAVGYADDCGWLGCGGQPRGHAPTICGRDCTST